MHTLDILNTGDALLFQESGEVVERERVPLNRFRAVVLATMVKNVLFNCGFARAKERLPA
jgi:hypothetical protein